MTSNIVNLSDSKVVEKLEETNYAILSWKMRLVLKGRGLWGVVSGGETLELDQEGMSLDPEQAETFRAKEEKAYLLIFLSLGDLAIAQVQGMETSKEVWDILKSTHETRGIAGILIFQRQLAGSKLQENRIMAEHIEKLKGIARQLEIVGAPVEKQ